MFHDKVKDICPFFIKLSSCNQEKITHFMIQLGP